MSGVTTDSHLRHAHAARHLGVNVRGYCLGMAMGAILTQVLLLCPNIAVFVHVPIFRRRWAYRNPHMRLQRPLRV